MSLYLLDTNILSNVIWDPRGACASRIGETPPEQVCTSIVVAAELRYGVCKRGSSALAQRVEQLLASLTVLPLQSDADQCYGRLRADLERQGQLIGANDMLIAAHALAVDAVLVTDNTAEFTRVEGLAVENWLRPA
ncbi:type II toxin-antitoxin system VapC family toxin [Burkholderia multivorans]|uniref:type II toxin-antitoxin system VapC family toxin n=1 Tax=Burkholderia multivorans TaxID=87883 RepID=UPI001C25D1E7|nr:type II toxin-antitoxin system VapC family toxin [Burkholderia multivorans]MBU9486692.1 type II toxin-antitoxin system VapC family toxin [Burkholderia multivorans]